MARSRSESRGGEGYTPKRGWAAGQHFRSYYDYRTNARYRAAGYEDPEGRLNPYSYRAKVREEFRQEVNGGTALAYMPASMKANPVGEALILRAWTEGHRMGKKQTRSENIREQHRRNLDIILDELRAIRPDLFPTVDKPSFWYH